MLGIQPDGLEVFAPNGKAFRFPAWSFERVLMSWIVRSAIYRGVRETRCCRSCRNTGCRDTGSHRCDRRNFRRTHASRAARLGVLATIKSNGLPQLSPVTPYYDRDADVIYVSMTEGRAKTANLRRDPRAALEVTSSDGWAWATAEGPVTLTGPGSDPHGPEVEALVDYYRSAAGEHPDWDEYRSVMVSDRRVLMAMTVERVYGEKIR